MHPSDPRSSSYSGRSHYYSPRRRQTAIERNAEAGDRLAVMGEALLARLRGVEPAGQASIYDRCRLGDFETLCKVGARGTVALAGAAGIADFAFLLADVAERRALDYYRLERPSYRLVTRDSPFRNFKPHRHGAVDFSPLSLVAQHAEYRVGLVGEVGEDVVAATYGAILGLSRAAIVNDDSGALDDVALTAAAQAVAAENQLFWALLASNPVLRDGHAYFSSAHANVAPAGALSPTALGNAFALLRQQTSPSGAKITMAPRFLAVGPTNEIAAREALLAITPPSGVAPVELVVEAHITDSTYYVFADPRLRPGWVAGRIGTLTVMPRPGFKFAGVELKASLDFGTGPVDPRPAVRGPGA